jgi:hypothetical protein
MNGVMGIGCRNERKWCARRPGGNACRRLRKTEWSERNAEKPSMRR